MENETIIHVGAEGGSLTLYGVRNGPGWLFSRYLFDQTMSWTDGGPEVERNSMVVSTWTAALKLLDEYPWHHLYPLTVHPDFQAKVLKAVVARNKRDGHDHGIERWQRICGSPVEG
jgi:hypothetical protein